MGNGSSIEPDVLYSHDQGTPTELDTISHQFIIDIARPTESIVQLLEATKKDLSSGRFSDQISDHFDY